MNELIAYLTDHCCLGTVLRTTSRTKRRYHLLIRRRP